MGFDWRLGFINAGLVAFAAAAIGFLVWLYLLAATSVPGRKSPNVSYCQSCPVRDQFGPTQWPVSSNQKRGS